MRTRTERRQKTKKTIKGSAGGTGGLTGKGVRHLGDRVPLERGELGLG